MTASYYWYDLETSGIQPSWDRIVQFAGLRTDLALQPIGDEYVTYIQLPDDVIPSAEAALVTGITPQTTLSKGVSEWSALRRINQLFSVRQTCVVGYNNLRFDDEFVRYGLYRNLMDPYAREWRDGNSRWDILELARAAGALRPEGIKWPRDDQGSPTYRLEALAAANGLDHGRPHEALSDVYATLALAKLLRTRQPRLFEYFFNARLKQSPQRLLRPFGAEVRVHISGRYPSRRYCFAPVVSVCEHPVNANSIIVADVGEDIEPLIEWSEDRLREALFSAGTEVRPPLKEVRINKCPFIAPLAVVRPADAARLGFDVDLAMQRRQRLLQAGIAEKTRRLYESRNSASVADVEAMLYDRFIDDDDRARCASFNQALTRGQWRDMDYGDPRLPDLSARLKARNFPERQSHAERTEWRGWVRDKIHAVDAPWLTLDTAQAQLDELGKSSDVGERSVLRDLSAHLDRLRTEFSR